jgi:hypothetical protein
VSKELCGHVSATAAPHAEVHVYQGFVITHYGPVFRGDWVFEGSFSSTNLDCLRMREKTKTDRASRNSGVLQTTFVILRADTHILKGHNGDKDY